MIHLTHFKPAFLPLLLNLCFLLSLSACKKERRSTKVFGRVIDNTQQPVANVQILIQGTRLGGLKAGVALQRLITDKQGLYSITVVPDKEYSGIQVINQFFYDPALANKYKDYTPYYNGQKAIDCCPAMIGVDTEYDFTLYP
jgi:hypothetical protein